MLSERIANCLVLNDWEGQIEQSKWMALALMFFQEMGVKPDVCECGDGRGQVKRLKLRTVENHLKAGRSFSGISLYSTLPPHSDLVRGWTHFSGFNATGTRKKVLAFIYDAQGGGVDNDLFFELVDDLSPLIGIRYGYGFQLPFHRGPAMYVYDIAYGLNQALPEDRDEYQRMSLWYVERIDLISQGKLAQFRHFGGLHRDVYPFNILNFAHLSREIEGQSLESWINAREGRGSLRQMTRGVWSWVISAELVPIVRDHLQSAGLLICRPRPLLS